MHAIDWVLLCGTGVELLLPFVPRRLLPRWHPAFSVAVWWTPWLAMGIDFKWPMVPAYLVTIVTIIIIPVRLYDRPTGRDPHPVVGYGATLLAAAGLFLGGWAAKTHPGYTPFAASSPAADTGAPDADSADGP